MTDSTVQSLHQIVSQIVSDSSSVADVLFGLHTVFPARSINSEVDKDQWKALVDASIVRVTDVDSDGCFRVIFDSETVTRCLEVSEPTVTFHEESFEVE